MHTVPQNKDEFTISNLFYYCEAHIFTHPLAYKFLCGLIFMGHPVGGRGNHLPTQFLNFLRDSK